MNNTCVSLKQLDSELEIIIKIPLQPFIELLAEKIEPLKEGEIKSDGILCTKEASQLLRVSCRTLDRWRKAGKLKYISRGKRVFFKRSSLDELNVETRLKGVKF